MTPYQVILSRAFFPFLLLFFVAAAQAQSSQELRKQQADIQKEIDDLRKTLAATQKNKKASLGELAIVQKKLRLREKAIGNINSQIDLIQGNITRSRSDINKMRKELDTLRIQYQKSVVYAYKNRSSYDFLNFVFSAADFNDAFKRIEYLKVYRSFRQQQAEHIRQTQVMLQSKLAGLEMSKKEKDQVLQSQQKEKLILQEERNEKDQVVKQLKMRESEINKELANKAKLDKKLRDGIAAAIKRETDKAVVAAKKNAPASTPVTPAPAAPGSNATVRTERPKSPLEATPEGAIISADFEKNKGRLPWPVDKGRIKIHYGVYSIEGTSLHGNNPGLTIETDAGSAVRSIFEGEVITVFDVEGTSAIVVKHGKYFSSYGNLSTVSVGKGQKVTAGQVIGKAAMNNDGNGEIEFLLMQESRNVNPEPWIR